MNFEWNLFLDLHYGFQSRIKREQIYQFVFSAKQPTNQPHSIDLNIQHSTDWTNPSIYDSKTFTNTHISLNFNHNFTTTDCSWFTTSFYILVHLQFERFFFLLVRIVLSNGIIRCSAFVVVVIVCIRINVSVLYSI